MAAVLRLADCRGGNRQHIAERAIDNAPGRERATFQLAVGVRHIDVDGDRPTRGIDRWAYPCHASLEGARISHEMH